jgi:hypothetical protein
MRGVMGGNANEDNNCQYNHVGADGNRPVFVMNSDDNGRQYNGYDDNTAITNLFNTLRFTRQTQRELSEWLPEIAYREDTTVDNIINNDKIQSILNSEKLNAPQKSKKIRDIFYKMRFPEYSKLQDRWKKTAVAANPDPSKVQFIPSASFEKKRLEVKLTIENPVEAAEILKSLSRISPQTWDDLLFPR